MRNLFVKVVSFMFWSSSVRFPDPCWGYHRNIHWSQVPIHVFYLNQRTYHNNRVLEGVGALACLIWLLLGILKGTVVSAGKMKRTVVVRRNYLHYISKYKRYEKRHTNIPAHCSPALEVKEGDVVTIGECRWVYFSLSLHICCITRLWWHRKYAQSSTSIFTHLNSTDLFPRLFVSMSSELRERRERSHSRSSKLTYVL